MVSKPSTMFGRHRCRWSPRLCTPAIDPPSVRLCAPRSQLSVFSTLQVVVLRGAGAIVCVTPLPMLAGKLRPAAVLIVELILRDVRRSSTATSGSRRAAR